MGNDRRTIAIDSDGVLSLYSGDSSQPPGPPVPHAREFVEKLRRRGLKVIVFSSRDEVAIFGGKFEGLTTAIWEQPWWQNPQKRSRTKE